MQQHHKSEAAIRASNIINMIVILFGNFCAVSAGYFGFRTKFATPDIFQVGAIFVLIWLIVTLLLHSFLKPYLEKRFQRVAGE